MASPREIAEKLLNIWYPPSLPSNQFRDAITVALEAYGRECREAALEEAMRVAEGRCDMHVDYWDAPKQGAKRAIVKAIRALKEKP